MKSGSIRPLVCCFSSVLRQLFEFIWLPRMELLLQYALGTLLDCDCSAILNLDDKLGRSGNTGTSCLWTWDSLCLSTSTQFCLLHMVMCGAPVDVCYHPAVGLFEGHLVSFTLSAFCQLLLVCTITVTRFLSWWIQWVALIFSVEPE